MLSLKLCNLTSHPSCFQIPHKQAVALLHRFQKVPLVTSLSRMSRRRLEIGIDAAWRFTFARLNTEVLNYCRVYNIRPPHPAHLHPASTLSARSLQVQCLLLPTIYSTSARRVLVRKSFPSLHPCSLNMMSRSLREKRGFFPTDLNDLEMI